jgi:hypothetical protein
MHWVVTRIRVVVDETTIEADTEQLAALAARSGLSAKKIRWSKAEDLHPGSDTLQVSMLIIPPKKSRRRSCCR